MTGARTYNIKRRNNNNNNKGYKHRICQHYKRVVRHKRNHNSLEERYRFTCIFERIYGFVLQRTLFYCFARSTSTFYYNYRNSET